MRTWSGAARAARTRCAQAAAAASLLAVAACGGHGSSAGARATAPATAPARTAASAPASPSAAGAPSPTAATADAYDPARDAGADIAAAQRAAAADGRPVLIDFGADWCPDCQVLGRTFTRPATAKLLAGYHVVRVDVGQFDHNLGIAARYLDLDTSGIPALVVLDPHGKVRTTTGQGEFADARSMPESQVDAFLAQWD